MIPNFSEFSYGFALTREMCDRMWGRFDTAPLFPSLVEEGREGHDVRLDLPGNPLFLQFKVSEYMVRPTAREWPLFRRPYYRFWLQAPRHSNQHELLLQRDQDPNIVYYAAPATHRVEDLNRAFLSRTVIEESVFFRPRDIGPLPDREAHCIAFERGSAYGYRCSDPKQITLYSVGQAILDKLANELATMSRIEDSRKYFGDLADQLLTTAYEKARLLDREISLAERIPDPARRAAYLCRTVLGAELLWITEPRT